MTTTETGYPPAQPDFEVWDPRSGNMLRSAPGPDVRAWLRDFRERHGDEAAMALSAGPEDDSWTVTGAELLRLCEAGRPASGQPPVSAWRKSSRSSHNGQCIEVASWRTARASNSGACVEVGSGSAVVGVRDSTDRGGPVLTFRPDAWRVFAADLKAGQLQLSAAELL